MRYASLLGWGTRAGLVLLVVSFAVYVSGTMPSLVPPQQLPQLWSQPVGAYLAATGAPTGWNWLVHLSRGDMAALASIAWLAACSVPCLLALLPLARARGDRWLIAMCVAEALVIAAAASGLISGGH
jgi:hypothetical protein